MNNQLDVEFRKAVNECKKNGFAIARGVLSTRMIKSLYGEVTDLVRSPDSNRKAMYFLTENTMQETRITRAERIWETVPSLSTGAVGARLKLIADQYFGECAVLFKDKVNVRESGSSGYAPHQDSAAGWDAFADRFLSVCVFLHKSSPEYGGFEVISGVHENGRFRNEDGRISLSEFNSFSPIQVVAEAGDIILLDSEAPHRTLPNPSGTTIFHLVLTFCSGSSFGAREEYYNKKEKDFARGHRGNIFKFRVFSFE